MAASTEDRLRQAIWSTPIIDHHAHPLLKPAALPRHPLLTIASEAQGAALSSAPHSLAHLRAVNQLSRLLDCPPTWESVSARIKEKQAADYEAWTKVCLRGIAVVLVDDGLDMATDARSYVDFDDYTPGNAKRILRIEPLVADIIEQACVEFDSALDAFKAVTGRFIREINAALSDTEIVAFKSVICYRTGLALPRQKNVDVALQVLSNIHRQRRSPGASPFTRLDHDGLNSFFCHLLAEAIREDRQAAFKKPIQFHTGLGDNDITLTTSSPSHLQDFIRAFPAVPIVLLHAGYPFTRELGYLAAMYANVYADIGEVFPILSREGQENVVRQILELCPHSKLLYSTDGHHFPEFFYCAVLQGREVVNTIVRDYIRKGDLSADQAVELVENIFFHNANSLYNLGLNLKHMRRDMGTFIVQAPPSSPSQSKLEKLSHYINIKDEARFLCVYWNDMTATPRMRAIPMRRVLSMLENGEELSFGVTKASMGLIQNDAPAKGVSPSGEWRLHPDLATLRPGHKSGRIVTRGDFKEQNGSPVDLCPRTILKRALDLAAGYNVAFSLGFEIELVIMRRISGSESRYEALDGDGHAWSVARAMDHEVATEVIEEAVEFLDKAGIYVEIVHPESANGQYEVVLPKTPALQAVDNLLYAREILSSHATSKGYKMTLHPKPFAAACGTAAHVHMSISSQGGDNPMVYEPFYAGILSHLRAISAFTYSSSTSYERVVDGVWAGGTYIGWGTQNRETPLRKIDGSHWEIKCIDGLANPYLALAAIVSAGIDGYAKSLPLVWRDCGDLAPFAVSDATRRELGITARFPSTLPEALKALLDDESLVGLVGRELVDRYVAVKFAEEDFLKGMKPEERRLWILERY
jgi:glutamine synthetase